MNKVKVIISNTQKMVKVPTGIRLLIRRCCHAVLQLENLKILCLEKWNSILYIHFYEEKP